MNDLLRLCAQYPEREICTQISREAQRLCQRFPDHVYCRGVPDIEQYCRAQPRDAFCNKIRGIIDQCKDDREKCLELTSEDEEQLCKVHPLYVFCPAFRALRDGLQPPLQPLAFGGAGELCLPDNQCNEGLLCLRNTCFNPNLFFIPGFVGVPAQPQGEQPQEGGEQAAQQQPLQPQGADPEELLLEAIEDALRERRQERDAEHLAVIDQRINQLEELLDRLQALRQQQATPPLQDQQSEREKEKATEAKEKALQVPLSSKKGGLSLLAVVNAVVIAGLLAVIYKLYQRRKPTNRIASLTVQQKLRRK